MYSWAGQGVPIARPSASRLIVLYAVFLLSGAAGLIYELLWTRYLGLFVGHSATAQIIVLVVFMGGMALGAVLVAERSDRLASPLLWYAGIELVIGGFGLLFHGVFSGVTSFAYETAFPALSSPALVQMTKWLLAAVVILPQSILLGATFPLMSAGVIRLAPERSGRSLALLYFTNSLGAATGVLLAGFVLIARFGLPGTMRVAAVLNVAVALVVVATHRVARAPRPHVPATATPDELAETPLSRLLLLTAFGTAVSSFIYEVAWTRMLSLVLASATHAFELMLSAFILGLAIGAFVVRSRADAATPARLAVVQLAMGALAIATLPVYLASYGWMSDAMRMFAPTNEGYRAMNAFRYGVSLAVMLPATICAGMTLPLITQLLVARGRNEQAIGWVYGLNSLGSILGVALAGLVLMPLIGLKWLIITGGAIDAALGIALLRHWRRDSPRATRVFGVAAAAVAVALLVLIVRARFEPSVLASGVYRHGLVRPPGNVVFYRDGRTASVAVRHGIAERAYTVTTNGKPDASLGEEWLRPSRPGAPPHRFLNDASTQTLLALITLAHAPDAKQAAVIGLGSGMSSHVLLGSPAIEQAVTVEIEPAMVDAAVHFMPANRRIFEDPRARFAIDDARAFLATSPARYDIIVAEPSNPWVSGVAGLFTTEFYATAARHLTERGVLGQWLHVTEISDALVLSVLSAVSRHFRSYSLFTVGYNDILIVATNAPSPAPPDWTIVQRYPGLAADFARIIPMTPHFFETLRLGNERALGPVAREVPANSDFRPVLDVYAERARFTRRDATGILNLAAERFSPSLALSGHRNGFGMETRVTIEDVPRLDAALASARLRAVNAGASDRGPGSFRHQVLRRALQEGTAPRDWHGWVQAITEMEAELHGGSAGVADTAFHGLLERFLRRTSPPEPVRAAVDFLRGVATWDFALVERASRPLVFETRVGNNWLAPDLVRDATVTAYLVLGRPSAASAIFGALAPYSRRNPNDARTMLLESAINAASDAARRAGTP